MALKPSREPVVVSAPAQPPEVASKFARWSGLAAIVLIAVVLVANVSLARADAYVGTAVARTWILTALLILGFMMVAGMAINGRPAGLLIDNRNRVSLSKLQMAAWTVLIVSALSAMVASRIAAGIADPLLITIQGELLAALGIASGSLVATPALLSIKAANPPPTGTQLNAVARDLGISTAEIDATGGVFGRKRPSGARWLDMFRGEDISNAATPDLSKVQQFLLTLLVIGVYTAAIADMFLRKQATFILAPQGQLPPMSQQFIWLLGISHASYLAYKAMPHGPPAPAPAPPPPPAPRRDDP